MTQSSSNSIFNALFKTLLKQELSVSFAESCTGGLISSLFTKMPGVSKVFYGGLVCYSNHTKREILGVRSTALNKWGAVSKQVAEQMAKGAKKVFSSDWSVAVTGVAGPSGGTKSKPVGLVFIAVAGPSFVTVEKKRFKGSRQQVQRQTAHFAAKMLLSHINMRRKL